MSKRSPSTLLLYGRIEVKVRVSHISRKTSEIWGTHRLVAGRDSKGAAFIPSSKDLLFLFRVSTPTLMPIPFRKVGL
jgi:hypothetical protein